MKVTCDFSKNLKQDECMKLLLDHNNGITEIFYGGASGGAKSYTGCSFVNIGSLRYPGTRWLLGRSVLKTLKETTLVTLFEVFENNGFKPDIHYKYNTKDNIITYSKALGGSEILLKDLFAYPADPDFDSFGSLAVTGAFIDETPQITWKAIETLSTRIRWKITHFCSWCHLNMLGSKQIKSKYADGYDEWICKNCGKNTQGLEPKILLAGNPSKNWSYNYFYKPYVNNTLEPHKVFIHAFVRDNPYMPQKAIDRLANLKDGIAKSRLYYGEWEYDDDENALMEYDKIMAIFTNNLPSGQKYITCDPARKGKNKAVIYLWDDWTVIKTNVMNKSKTPEIEGKIEAWMRKYSVRRKNVIVDEEGLGGGIVDHLRCYGFVSSEKPFHVKGQKMNYLNRKAQLYDYLADRVNEGLAAFKVPNIEIQEDLTQELEQVKRYKGETDGKFQIVPKKEVIAAINRSPDHSDAFMLRGFFDLKKYRKFKI